MTQLPGYQPGKSIDDVRDIAKTSAIIKVGSNENVLGPSPKAIKAASRAAAEAHLYPANQETVLIEELIKQLGNTLTVDHFTTGNGSSDVIRQIVNAFIHKGDNIIICKPTFAIYEIYTSMRGGETLNVAHDKFKTHFEGMRKAVNSKTRLVFVCNPNNPTGLVVTHDELKRFMDTLPEHVVMVLDGAYYEFSEHPDMPRELELIEAGYNLISTRTFSKLSEFTDSL